MRNENTDAKTSKLDKFLLEYFKYLREEINLRVSKHTDILIYKFISIGAIVTYILEAQKTQFEIIELIGNSMYLIWIVPIVSTLFDMIILGNLRVVRNIGVYTYNNYENILLKPLIESDRSLASFDFWETAGAQQNLRWRCYTKFDMTAIYSITFYCIFSFYYHLGI